jgi:ABC-type polysaccharide/polyol phosphate export permease
VTGPISTFLPDLLGNMAAADLVTEVFALAIFTVGLLAARGAVPLSVLWLPVLVIPQLLLTLGLCWFLAALGVYVRDLGQVNGFLLTLWFFLTPICYPVESLPPPAMPVLSKNPLFVLGTGYGRDRIRRRSLAGGCRRFESLHVMGFGLHTTVLARP